jgi:uncharacterized protein GlcG (DUF336 family)
VANKPHFLMGEESMSILLRIGFLTVACGLATPAGAQLITEKNISAEMAMTMADTAYQACKAQGYHVSVHIIDREGLVKLALRGDGASPHTFENSDRKAYTARTFRMPSGEFATRNMKPGEAPGPATNLSRIIAIQGALPIKVGDDTIGAIGVSGAPGGDKDEACAKAGLDKVSDQLK